MKTNRNAVLKRSAWLSVMALVASLHLAESAQAQATSRPPERMTYQGFIAGSDGVALGNTAPRNYDVIFRIYDGEGSNTPLWGEQQTVTVDKGYFSVLLGEGAAVPGTPNAGVTLSSLFNSATASERYVSFTVKGVGSGGADIEILPRVRLMSSPYAFLANRALAATRLVQDDAAGTDLLTTSGNAATLNGTLRVQGATTVNGTLNILGANVIGLGVGIPGKEGSAGQIGYGTHSGGESLDIVGAGTTAANRKVRFYAEGGIFLGGPVTGSTLNLSNDINISGNIRSRGLGIILGENRTKAYDLNGSILYTDFLGKDSLVLQGGGNLIAERQVTIYAEGGCTVVGGLNVNGNGTFELGRGLTKGLDNGKIGYGIFTANALDIVGGGTTQAARRTQIHGNVVLQGIQGGSLFPLDIGGFQTGSLVGLRVNAAMQAHSYQTISDRRTKDIVGTSGHPQDLETLRGIRVVDYRWKTHPNNQRRLVKGVIAQELLSVMPEAISVSSSTVPCVPVQATRVEWQGTDKPLHVEFSEGHGLNGGERIHLEVDGHRIETSVNDVPDAKSIRVSALDMAAQPKAVVLIGREVKDFLSVDYQQIYMTAISALQELDRRLQGVDQRVQEVEKREARVTELEAKMARMADLEKKAARVENLERDMAELRKLVAGMQATKERTESASVSPASPSVSVVTAR
jgi:hypothetical protein